MVSTIHYKAFISYSHVDERWARWLQKALESYRVPKRLVGTEGEFGPIPGRLQPVFRDREDLSSASDLSNKVKGALQTSESLIVVCSPASARSEWVNEEIRYFSSLGRGDRIHALIVDGDPRDASRGEPCFPPALTRDDSGTAHEPLAADARKWADGKLLARLKIISGILGIRLDDLRRRDMQRRHRLWTISMAGAFLITLTMSVLAMMAISARNAAENRRAHAEDLVGYMVGDLRTKLDEVGRLDILEGMGGRVSDYLQTLDAGELTKESLTQQARVWRQLGEVSMDQGELEEALGAFAMSRDILAELARREPDTAEYLFELGNAEFWVGYVFVELGEFAKAKEAFSKYMEYASRLAEFDPGNAAWLQEKGYAHSNLAALVVRQDSANVEYALEHIRASVDISEQVMALDPDNDDYVSDYGEALAWLADTQMLVCDLGGAVIARRKSAEIAREQMIKAGSNANLSERYALALTGLARLELQVGLAESAKRHYRDSQELLESIAIADRTNLNLRWDVLLHEFYQAYIAAETGSMDEAVARLESVRQPMQDVLEVESFENVRRLEQWVYVQLWHSDIIRRAGRLEAAGALMDEALGDLRSGFQHGEAAETMRDELMLARFLYWQQYRSDLLTLNDFAGIQINPRNDKQSCDDVSNTVRQAIVEGDRAGAKSNTAYLLNKGYYEPAFVRICSEHELCERDE